MKVIEELRVENTPLSTSIADHIESFTDYDFAHLLFSNGYVVQSISLEKQLNIIQVADLVLPDKETSFEEYTTMELLSVAMLIVISTFALDFIHTDRDRKSTRLNSSHVAISYAVFCLKKKKILQTKGTEQQSKIVSKI